MYDVGTNEGTAEETVFVNQAIKRFVQRKKKIFF